MAKRGRKPAGASNSKGRPRTRSQLEPVVVDEKKLTTSKSKPVKNNKKTKDLNVNDKDKGGVVKAKITYEKSSAKSIVESSKKNKTKNEKVNKAEKNKPAKIKNDKAEKVKTKAVKTKSENKVKAKNDIKLEKSKNETQKPLKKATKRKLNKQPNDSKSGQKSTKKLKTVKIKKIIEEIPPVDELDDETEEDEEFVSIEQINKSVEIEKPIELDRFASTEEFTSKESDNFNSTKEFDNFKATKELDNFKTSKELDNFKATKEFENFKTFKELPPAPAEIESSKVSYQFESSLEKLQQETMAPKPFNINNQESYLSSLYNPITSSSTSAFSVPIVPKPPHLMTQPDSIISSILQPVNISNQTSMLPSNRQMLLSPPQNQSSSDPVHDLPQELLNLGWRKFWSRREERPYYFNKNSNESLWEMPKLPGQTDPTTDPLGIQSSQNFQPPPTPTDPGTPPIYPVFTPSFAPFIQKSSESLNNEKKSFIGPFDFEIDSNCYMWEGLVFYYFHPHPETELLRSSFIFKLRQQYYELCHTREGIEAPKDSFTRWIMERKVIDKGCDSFIPSDCSTEMSKTLYNQIMNDIPIKLVKPKFSGEARKQLSKYAEAAKKMIDSPHVSPMSRKLVKWNVEDAFEWIRKTLNATYEDYIERLGHLKKQCQPHIIEAAKSSVESICLKIYHVSVDYSRRVRNLNLDIFKKEELRERAPIRFQNQKKVVCYPAYLINACPKLPPVQMFTEKDAILLRYKNGEFLRINSNYLQKLEMLYFYNCRDDRKYGSFLTRVWCMLKRYQAFFNKTEGLFAQNALPLSVCAALNKHFGVTFECFSSPLNCYFRQYCSIFPDTDGYFGSRGSILNFYPISGSFQAHPPDCEELIDATITHFEKLLENSIEPLSFIVFIQEMPETSSKIIPRLESNKFKRMHLNVPYLEHEYRHGFQFICSIDEVSVKSQYNTIIYFLQNDSGFLKWSPTPERVEELLESFKVGRDKELPILCQPSSASLNNQKLETEIKPNGE